VYSNTAAAGFNATAARIVEGRWSCFVAHIGISDTEGVVELWVDGELEHRSTGLDTRASGPYTQLGAGITWSYAGGTPTDIWIDDVAVSRTILTCD